MTFRIKQGIRNRYIFIFDMIMIVVCLVVSYLLRFEFNLALAGMYLSSAIWMLVLCLIIKPLVYIRFGLYRHLWAYASIDELRLIVMAVATSSVSVTLIMLLLQRLNVFTGFPRSVPIIDFLLSLLAVGGIRMGIRLVASQKAARATRAAQKYMKRVLIVGAGEAGVMVCKEMLKNPQLHLKPIGFIDDDKNKISQEVNGVRVLGLISQVDSLIDRYYVDTVLFAIPSAPGRVLRLVSDVCRQKEVPFQTMPGIYELLGGSVNINRVREVEITDLLRRDPVKLDQDNVGPILRDKTVLITGAGGSIGSEIARQTARWNPKKMLLLGHGENSIFTTLFRLNSEFPDLDVEPLIVDVRDLKRVRWAFEKYRPQIVFHAAAHKHVHLMEVNISEAVTNNIIGTQNIVRTAKEFNVERFVMISTDKAVRPVNIMGASKRVAENIVLNESIGTDDKYTVVRFGNVLGSRGSVVPIFQEQIRKGGPVTVTDPKMERYFMTIPEAVYLVLEAAGLSNNRETFVLDMGKQVRILDLAEDLIRLSGLEPGRDIEIQFTGVRPGEKLSEDLWNKGQELEPTVHPDIFKLERHDLIPAEKLEPLVERLRELAENEKEDEIRKLLNGIIPDANLLDN